MRHSLCIAISAALLSAPFVFGGCVSKAKAKADARAAYVAGQQDALRQMQQRAPAVVFSGQVRNPMVPWTADLTLARAIILADYYGTEDPRKIVISRAGEDIPIDPQQLLTGQDVPVQAGDAVRLE